MQDAKLARALKVVGVTNVGMDDMSLEVRDGQLAAGPDIRLADRSPAERRAALREQLASVEAELQIRRARFVDLRERLTVLQTELFKEETELHDLQSWRFELAEKLRVASGPSDTPGLALAADEGAGEQDPGESPESESPS